MGGGHPFGGISYELSRIRLGGTEPKGLVCRCQSKYSGLFWKKPRVDPSDILMVALDAATHTAVLLDENFQVIRPAIYWTDTRSKIQVNELRKEYEDFIYQKTLHSPDTIWTLPQLCGSDKMSRRYGRRPDTFCLPRIWCVIG